MVIMISIPNNASLKSFLLRALLSNVCGFWGKGKRENREKDLRRASEPN